MEKDINPSIPSSIFTNTHVVFHYIQLVSVASTLKSTPSVLTGATIASTSYAFLAFIYICNWIFVSL